MGVELDENVTPDELSKLMTDKIVEIMKATNLPSLKASGYSLEDCQAVAHDMLSNAGFQGVPKEGMDEDEVKKFIKLAYEAYQ